MRAMEKDRTLRYETANGLAMDVQRYLNDEVVQAAPPDFQYQIRKLYRRNRPVMRTILLLMLLLMVSSIVSAIQAVWAIRSEAKAEQEAVIAHAGEWVRYSSPGEDGAEYVAVCLPAFSPSTVHRDEE